jgi:hypothetical protein
MLKHHNNMRKGSRGKKHPQRSELGRPTVSSLVPADGILRNKHDYTFMLPFEQVSVSTYNWSGTSAALAGPLTLTPTATLSNICDVYRVKQIKVTLTANVSSPIAAITRYAVAYDPTSASALNYSAVARYADSISWSPSADNPSLEIIIKNPAYDSGSTILYDNNTVSVESSNPWTAGVLTVAPMITVTQNLYVDYEFLILCMQPRLF